MMSAPHEAQFSVSLGRVLWILIKPKGVPYGSKNSNNLSQETTNLNHGSKLFLLQNSQNIINYCVYNGPF